jgi:hypothetical protein
MRKIIFITFASFLTFLVLNSCNLFVGIGDVDKQPPTVEITSPKNGDIFGTETIIIKGIARDDEKLSKVYLKTTGDWIDIGNEENWSYKWDTSQVGSGKYKIQARAVDLVGNEATNEVEIYIDKSLPTLSISSPTNNQYVKGIIQISLTASDDESVSKVLLSTNAGTTFDITLFSSSGNNITISTNFDTTRLPDGDNILYFKVVDSTSKERNYQLTLRVDNQTPSITILSHTPNDGYVILSEDAIISGVVNDVYPPKSFTLVVGTNTNTVELSGFSWRSSLSFTLADPTTNTIAITVVDQVDVTNSTNITMIVDKAAPQSYITFPTAGYITNGTIITVSGYAVDDIGVSKIQISFDGGTNYSLASFSNANGTNYFSTNVNLNSFPEGNATFIARAYDFAGKSLNSQGILFTIDKTPPTITVSSPTNDTTVSTQFNIIASAIDNYDPIRMMIIKIDSVPVKTNLGNNIAYTYTTNTSGEGKRNIEVIAIDRAGNPSSVPISVIVNTDPAKVSNIAISSGGSGIYTRGIVTITGTAYDLTQISNVGYAIDNITNLTWFISNAGVSSTNFSFSFDSTSYLDGLHILYIRPVDNLGGFVDFSTNIYIDNTKPTITFINPSGDYQNYGGILNITMQVNDNISLSSFAVWTNGGLLTNDITSIFGQTSKILTFSWDLTPLSNGQTNFIATMLVDRANNTNYATNYFIVSNDLPELTVYTPNIGDFVSSNLIITGVAIYSNGIKNVKYKVGSGTLQDVQTNVFSSDGTTNNFTNISTTTSYVEGLTYVTVRAIASNGSYVDKSIPIYIDYTSPRGIISFPTNGDYYGTITISGVASDTNSLAYNSGVKTVKLYIKTNDVSLTGWDGVVLLDNISASVTNCSTNWDTTTLPVATNINIILEVIDNADNKYYTTNTINVRPYITSFDKYDTWIGNTLTINGYNFGTGSVEIVFKGNSAISASGLATSRTITIPTAKSGYVKLKVNGIESINSNWIDLWDFVNVPENSSPQVNSRFALDENNKIYFVQSGRSGASWATNFLITDALGSFQVIPIFGSSIPNGEVAGNGNAIYVRSNLIVAAYSPVRVGGIMVSILTNNGSSIQLRTNIQIDTITLAGTPLIDVFIDNSMKIYVAYFAKDLNSGTVRLAYSSNYGATWTIEDVETNLGADPTILDAHPSVYVDVYSNPHLAYLKYNGEQHLRHAYKSGTSWVVETVDSIQYNGLFSDMVIDTNNTIHISYENVDQGDTMYASKNGGGWTREIVDYTGIAGYFTSIDVKGNEKAISYYNNVYANGSLAYYDGSQWRVITIPQYTGVNAVYGRYTGVRFATDGNVWVGFTDGANQLWVAKYLK